MKVSKTPIALAVAAMMASPLAFSADAESGSLQVGAAHLTVDLANDNEADIDGNALSEASGNIGVNMAAGAYNQQTNSTSIAQDFTLFEGGSYADAGQAQVSVLNANIGLLTENEAEIEDHALEGASGNIGVNVAAGNGNQQGNNLAIASHNERFGDSADADADAGAVQATLLTGYVDLANENETELDDHALESASGNIGVNMATGNGNQQSNSTAIATNGKYGDADATAGAVQVSLANIGLSVFQDNEVELDDHALKGAKGNIGVNMAAGNGNQQSNGLAVAVSDGGLASATAGTAQASGLGLQIGLLSDNEVALSGSALQYASGNIGVNMAAGNANQQSNSLAIATTN